jgi:hypothetical protein
MYSILPYCPPLKLDLQLHLNSNLVTFAGATGLCLHATGPGLSTGGACACDRELRTAN